MFVEGLQIDLEKILDRWGLDNPKITGDEYLFQCPWVRHSTGQWKLYVNTRTGLWQCKACGDKQGNVLQLIALMEGLSYSEAAEWLRDHGNEIDFELFSDHILELLDDAEAEPLYNPRTKTIKQNTRRAIRESQLGGEYWKERGFYRDTIKFWNLRTRARNTYPYVIPFETSQEPNYYISRTGRANVFPKYLYQPGAPKSGLLFGAEHITGDVIVVCEGPLDCVAIWQAIKQRNAQSVYSPVAILGDYISIKQVKLLEEHAAQVILFLDNDDAGHRAIETFMKMKPPQLLTFVSDYSRTDAKDPGEMLPKEIIQAIGRSRLWVGE